MGAKWFALASRKATLKKNAIRVENATLSLGDLIPKSLAPEPIEFLAKNYIFMAFVAFIWQTKKHSFRKKHCLERLCHQLYVKIPN